MLKITVFSSALLLLTVFVSMGLVHTMGGNILKNQVLSGMSAIAKSKSDQVMSIVDQDFERAALVASRTQLRRSFIATGSGGDESPDGDNLKLMVHILQDAKNSVESIIDIDILSLEGFVVASTNPSTIGVVNKEHNWSNYSSQDKYQSKFNVADGEYFYSIALPLIHPDISKDYVIGVVMVEFSLDRMISVLSDRTGLKDTGEILLITNIEEEYIAINPLRHNPNSFLTVIDGDIHAEISSVRQGSGVLQEKDYRGIDTLKAYYHTPTEGKDLGLIVKADVSETLLPVRILQRYILLAGIVIWLFGSIILWARVAHIISPLNKILIGTQKLAEGDLDYRINVSTHDELGELTYGFNNMAESLQNTTTTKNELKYISSHDSMTGLYNRTYINQLLAEAVKNDKTIVFMFDIDKLKHVNDDFGHDAGDKLINSFADVIRQCFRETDIVARIGGDEFTAILYDGDEKIAKKIQQRIIELINMNNESLKDKDLELSVSFGYAMSESDKETIEDLMKKADALMYEDKEKKRQSESI